MIMKPFTNEILPQGYKMTELGPLPEEWEVIKPKEYFKEIKIKVGLENRDKYRPVAVGELGLRFREEIYKNKVKLTENTDKYLIFPYCSICFGLGAKTLAVDVNCEKNSKYSVSAAYKIFAFDEKIFNPIFLRSYIKHVQHLWGSRLLVQSVRQGKKIDKIIFNELPLPLPPLPEQQKIAAVLSAVQEAKEKTRAVIDATKALKKSMMKHLFTYGPVPPEETENVPLKETEIGKVPEDWEVVKLGEVVREKITDGTHKTPQYIENGIPFITITNLVNGKIDFSKCRFISEEEHNFLINRCKPEKDDVLLSKVGTLGLTAKICEKDNFSIFVQLALIKPKKEIINSDFLTYMLNSISIQNQIEIKSSQSTMKYIGVEKISQLQIPLPPLPVQQKIASILSAIDAKIEAEENKKKSLEKLFKTLLHNLMTAKIRVNHLEIKV